MIVEAVWRSWGDPLCRNYEAKACLNDARLQLTALQLEGVEVTQLTLSVRDWGVFTEWHWVPAWHEPDPGWA